eukprot:gene1421-2185_t
MKKTKPRCRSAPASTAGVDDEAAKARQLPPRTRGKPCGAPWAPAAGRARRVTVDVRRQDGQPSTPPKVFHFMAIPAASRPNQAPPAPVHLTGHECDTVGGLMAKLEVVSAGAAVYWNGRLFDANRGRTLADAGFIPGKSNVAILQLSLKETEAPLALRRREQAELQGATSQWRVAGCREDLPTNRAQGGTSEGQHAIVDRLIAKYSAWGDLPLMP